MSDQISEYMRAMQRKSAAARWAGKSPEQRSQEMRRLRAKSKKRKKAKRPNTGGLRISGPSRDGNTQHRMVGGPNP